MRKTTLMKKRVWKMLNFEVLFANLCMMKGKNYAEIRMDRPIGRVGKQFM